jgi:hypothetical protein
LKLPSHPPFPHESNLQPTFPDDCDLVVNVADFDPDDKQVPSQLHHPPPAPSRRDDFPLDPAPLRLSKSGWRRGADRALARDFTTMTTTNITDGGLDPNPPNDTQRARWATRKMTIKSSSNKRHSLLNRVHKKTNSNEKNPPPEGSDPPADDGEPPIEASVNQDENDEDDDTSENRTLFFNQPLPDSLLDEDGHPVQSFPRNKIRTAKYTPISFIPKNLWFQFHNVANIFFLFLVILVVSTCSYPFNSYPCKKS